MRKMGSTEDVLGDDDTMEQNNMSISGPSDQSSAAAETDSNSSSDDTTRHGNDTIDNAAPCYTYDEQYTGTQKAQAEHLEILNRRSEANSAQVSVHSHRDRSLFTTSIFTNSSGM